MRNHIHTQVHESVCTLICIYICPFIQLHILIDLFILKGAGAHVPKFDVISGFFVNFCMEKRSVEQHSVAKLKRWLRCRKCTVKGKKQDIVKRLVGVIFVSYPGKKPIERASL